MDVWSVMVEGREVGLLWPARDGGYTLRTGTSLIRPKIHHFSPNEGLPGVATYLEKRFGGATELVPRE